MATYILTWNPYKWKWPKYDDVVAKTARGEIHSYSWSTGNNQRIKPGDRVFLLRQATERGMIGAGYATSEVYREQHWSDPKKKANYAAMDFETLLPVENVLDIEDLIAADLGINWNRIQASGIHVPEESVNGLETLWNQHLSGLGRLPDVLPNEVIGAAGYPEGALLRVTVNAYERNPAARRACLEHFGAKCAVCGFDFGEVYGEIGDGFIHVHHLRDLATLGGEYEVDPVEDLRPVCPNCHAMLHRKVPAISIEELKSLMSA